MFEIVEGALAACFKEIGVDDPAAVPAHAVRRGDGEVRLRQAGPALRHARSRTSARCSRESPFGIFREAVEHGGTVRGFVIPDAARYSRREVDELVEQAKQAGAAGLIWARHTADGVQVVGEGDRRRGRAQRARGHRARTTDDLLVLASGAADADVEVLGQLRLQVAKKENLIPEGSGSCSGSPTSRCSTGTPTRSAGTR